MATPVWRTLLLMGAAALLHGQQGTLAGPTSGFVFDRAAHALRPLLGVPGGSTIGDPVSLGTPLASAWIAPRQDAAIATAVDGSLRYFRIGAGGVTEQALPGIPGAPQNVVFSPSGTAAALLSGGMLQVVQGLPADPKPGARVELTTAAGRMVRVASGGRPGSRRLSIAISDDGSYLLVNEGTAIHLLGNGGEDRSLMEASDAALAAFAPGGHDAAVLDAKGAGLILLRDVPGAAAQKLLEAADGALASPAGIAFSSDGQRLFVASAGALEVIAFDLTTGARTTIPAGCVPAGLVRMGDLFRLNDFGSEPLWLLDPGAARVVFVPALSVQ
jgi:hypothetical protein